MLWADQLFSKGFLSVAEPLYNNNKTHTKNHYIRSFFVIIIIIIIASIFLNFKILRQEKKSGKNGMVPLEKYISMREENKTFFLAQLSLSTHTHTASGVFESNYILLGSLSGRGCVMIKKDFEIFFYFSKSMILKFVFFLFCWVCYSFITCESDLKIEIYIFQCVRRVLKEVCRTRLMCCICSSSHLVRVFFPNGFVMKQ